MVKVVNQEAFLSDYNIVLAKKNSIVANATEEANKLNYPQEIIDKVKDQLIELNTNEVNKELAFYEKYLEDKNEDEEILGE